MVKIKEKTGSAISGQSARRVHPLAFTKYFWYNSIIKNNATGAFRWTDHRGALVFRCRAPGQPIHYYNR